MKTSAACSTTSTRAAWRRTPSSFYTSDQGWYLGEHGWYDKRWMYEESFRTPLLVRWPGKTKPGSVSDKMVMNLDFAETFLDIAGVEDPGRHAGQEPRADARRARRRPTGGRASITTTTSSRSRTTCIRTTACGPSGYKLIHFYTIDAWELFDLEKDPHELKSVYDDPAYATVVADMKKELKRLMEQYKDDGTSVVQFERDPAAASTGEGEEEKIRRSERNADWTDETDLHGTDQKGGSEFLRSFVNSLRRNSGLGPKLRSKPTSVEVARR